MHHMPLSHEVLGIQPTNVHKCQLFRLLLLEHEEPSENSVLCLGELVETGCSCSSAERSSDRVCQQVDTLPRLSFSSFVRAKRSSSLVSRGTQLHSSALHSQSFMFAIRTDGASQPNRQQYILSTTRVRGNHTRQGPHPVATERPGIYSRSCMRRLVSEKPNNAWARQVC